MAGDVILVQHFVSRFTGQIIPVVGKTVLYDFEWLPCDGREIAIKEEPQLFALIGYLYGSPMIAKRLPFQWVRRRLGLSLLKLVPNPDAPPKGFFRLPDLRPRSVV